MNGTPVLNILKDGQTIRTMNIEGEIMLGRDKECEISLNEKAVSRHHAIFKKVGGHLQIEKKSEFGLIHVNGAEVTVSLLKEGDIVTIGPYLIRVSQEVHEEPEVPVAVPQENADSAMAMPMGGVANLEIPIEPVSENNDSNDSVSVDEVDAQGSELGVEANSAPVGEGLEGEAAFGAEVPAAQENSSDLLAVESEGNSLPDMDGDGKTRITPSAKLDVKLIFKPGGANVEEFPLTQNEVSIGRGKDCDIVLNDKKSSRKNSIIKRAGARFLILDLSSVNGTYVNGEKIQERELSGGDLIRIGGVEFKFQAQSADYAEQEQGFMSLPSVPELDESAGFNADLGDNGELPGLDGGSSQIVSNDASGDYAPSVPGTDFSNQMPDPSFMAGVPGMGNALPGSDNQKRTLLERFKALPKRTQIIGVVAALLVGSWLMEEDEKPIKKKAGENQSRKVASTSPTPGPSDKITVSFEALSPEQKAFVENEHSLAFEYYKNKDYDKALFEIGKVLAIIPDYKDTKELEKYAKEGKRKIEAIEEEKKKKEEEAQLKAKINRLVEEARSFMDKKEYEKAGNLFTDILALDPDNAAIADWRNEIQASEEKIKIEEQQRQAREELNQQGWAIFKEATVLRKQRKYLSAVDVYSKIFDLGVSDPRLPKMAQAMILKSKSDLRKAVQPVLQKAKELEAAGDLSGAFGFFKKTTQINPNESAGYAGMNRVRGVLHDRAKILYTEAILAESYSDFVNAKRLYNEIMKVAPPDDIYHDRAQRKLAHYFQREEAPSQ